MALSVKRNDPRETVCVVQVEGFERLLDYPKPSYSFIPIFAQSQDNPNVFSSKGAIILEQYLLNSRQNKIALAVNAGYSLDSSYIGFIPVCDFCSDNEINLPKQLPIVITEIDNRKK